MISHGAQPGPQWMAQAMRTSERELQLVRVMPPAFSFVRSVKKHNNESYSGFLKKFFTSNPFLIYL